MIADVFYYICPYCFPMDEIIFNPRNTLEERQWDILFEQIVRGNVIPVIGPDFVKIKGKTSVQFLIDVICRFCNIGEGQFNSFSQLVNDDRYKASEINKYSDIYSSLTDLINDNPRFFEDPNDNVTLRKFLEIPFL